MKQDNNLCTIYFVRHGETDWNVQRRTQGHTDISLNANGESQAHLLREELKDIRFNAVYSSDLQRAKKTAEIISLEHQIAVQATKALRERSYGPLEGKKVVENIALMNELLSNIAEEEKWTFKPFPEMESDEELISRIIIFLREISIANPGKTVLVVSHGGVIKEILIHFGYDTQDKIYNLKIENGAYIKFQSDGVDFFIRETVGIVSK